MRFPTRKSLHSVYLLRERDHGDVLTDDLQIHFFELPKFKKHDVRELATPADHWLHMLRFAQEYIRGGMRLPEKLSTEEGVAMAFDKMQRAQSDEEVRAWMFSREKFTRDVATSLANAREDGLQQGRQQGSLEGRRETARRLLAEGFEVAVVARSTQLTAAEVEALRSR
ncbi:MAG: Rpn family recombination-promoting nuclease/putative transposase [Proteobacteria bacterium]|nr:Rpn family recombination-promoting nuclease/putative transposase [Pseudomonadota bacterium]